jgi:hypothetical protein
MRNAGRHASLKCYARLQLFTGKRLSGYAGKQVYENEQFVFGNVKRETADVKRQTANGKRQK